MSTQENEPDGRPPIDWAAKFPDMRPVKGPPPLFTINGCGVRLYSRTAADEETATYVKTLGFCLLFIPLIALRAYRVADAANGGWYFIGREPLSAVAKAWNTLVLLACLAVGGREAWLAHAHSPESLARARVVKAEGFLSSGKVEDAARTYAQVAAGSSSQAGDARAALAKLVEERLPQLSLEAAASVARCLAGINDRVGQTPLRAPLLAVGMARLEKGEREDPHGALKLFDVLAPLSIDGKEPVAVRERLLRGCVAQSPDDVDLASELALILEGRDDLEGCESLLAPRWSKLGSSESARILGQIYSRRNEIEKAYAILAPYCEERLKRLHVAEKSYSDSTADAWERLTRELERGSPIGFDYTRYRSADEAVKEAMLTSFLQREVAKDAEVHAREERLKAETSVVPVALDLGIVRLRRGQSLSDPEARKKELEAAEQIFLAIRGVAGETDEFRLFYGQVSYWLGKQKEGRELLEKLLASNDRSAAILIAVARALRDVGEAVDSRRLVEEAHAKETDPRKQQEAARLRALVCVDLDDQIKWLRLANSSDPETTASLHAALGEKARNEGREQEAIDHVRDAIKTYVALPSASGALNNGALAHFTLYSLTGERSDYTKGVDMLEEAVALRPDDGILLCNTAYVLLESVLLDLVGESIDLRALKAAEASDLLTFLYSDEAGYQAVLRRLRAHKALARAVAYYERVLVLSPKSTAAVIGLLRVHGMNRDAKALRDLQTQLRTREPNLADEIQSATAYYGGTKHEDLKKQATVRIATCAKQMGPLLNETQPLNYAVGAALWVNASLSGWSLGITPDAERLVTIAEAAHAARPSAGTRSCLTSALLYRFSQHAAQKDPAFVAMASRARRSLTAASLVAAALGRSEQLRTSFLQDADGQRALQLLREHSRAFPDSPREKDWAVFTATDPIEAARVAQAFRASEFDRRLRDLQLALAPMSGSAVFDAFWGQQMEGRDSEAKEVLRNAKERGVPLPFDP